MAYLVLAYPKLNSKDFELIQNYRKEKDELYYNVVEPHFTIVFPVFDINKEDFIKEIKEKAKEVKEIDLVIRCVTINKDAFNEYFHTFMVPDEGYSKIVKLHDKLYEDKLFDNLRLDLNFVPHIGIGNSKDKFICKKMVDEWNRKDFSINGTISQLTIVKYENDKVEKIEEINLE
jgi:2'-5' RNA ligase